MKEHYAVFRFEGREYVVKYTCSKNEVLKDDIDDCATSYYDSDAYNEDNSYEDIIHDIMSSFEGVVYEIIDAVFIDME